MTYRKFRRLHNYSYASAMTDSNFRSVLNVNSHDRNHTNWGQRYCYFSFFFFNESASSRYGVRRRGKNREFI